MTPLWGRGMSRPEKARSCPRTPKGPANGTPVFHFWVVKESGMRPKATRGKYSYCNNYSFL
jgi:hypothetical protein